MGRASAEGHFESDDVDVGDANDLLIEMVSKKRYNSLLMNSNELEKVKVQLAEKEKELKAAQEELKNQKLKSESEVEKLEEEKLNMREYTKNLQKRFDSLEEEKLSQTEKNIKLESEIKSLQGNLQETEAKKRDLQIKHDEVVQANSYLLKKLNDLETSSSSPPTTVTTMVYRRAPQSSLSTESASLPEPRPSIIVSLEQPIVNSAGILTTVTPAEEDVNSDSVELGMKPINKITNNSKQCQVCGRYFRTRKRMLHHRRTTHFPGQTNSANTHKPKNRQNKTLRKPSGRVSQVNQSREESLSLPLERQLTNSLSPASNTRSKGSYPCQFCGRGHTRKSARRQHHNTCHARDKRTTSLTTSQSNVGSSLPEYEMPVLPVVTVKLENSYEEAFPSTSAKLHSQDYSKDKKSGHFCKCGHKSYDKDALRSHIKYNNGGWIFVCSVQDCLETFKTASKRNRHMNTKHGIESTDIGCFSCGSLFQNKDKLYEHQRLMHPRKKRKKLVVDLSAIPSPDSTSMHMQKEDENDSQIREPQSWQNSSPISTSGSPNSSSLNSRVATAQKMLASLGTTVNPMISLSQPDLSSENASAFMDVQSSAEENERSARPGPPNINNVHIADTYNPEMELGSTEFASSSEKGVEVTVPMTTTFDHQSILTEFMNTREDGDFIQSTNQTVVDTVGTEPGPVHGYAGNGDSIDCKLFKDPLDAAEPS